MALATSDAVDERRILRELRGNTLLVYWYLLRKGKGSAGVREVQRALDFSSPSSASYHLEKLQGLGLVSKDPGGDYKVSRVVKIGVMTAFLFIGRFVIPKHLLYASATTLMILLFIVLFIDALSLTIVAALLPGIVAAGIFWYETLRIWRYRPCFR